MPKTIVLTGGGTAGHVMPNLALIPYLKGHFDEFHYIGSSGVEKNIIAAYSDIIFHEIPCVKLIRSLSLKNLKIPFVLMRGTAAAKRLIGEIAPSVIFSKGGYVALPVVRAAGKVPVVCHESDISMGLANRLSSKKCDIVCTSFDCTAKAVRNGVHTGAPIRDELFGAKRLDLEFGAGLPILLVMGGSLGARAINDCVKGAIDELCGRYNVLHIAGRGNLFEEQTLGRKVDRIVRNGVEFCKIDTGRRGRFYQCEFTSCIERFFATADIVVSRGGAGSMFELMSLKKRALIIPLPKGNSRGDQVENAAYFEQCGCCKVLSQDKLSSGSLLASLQALATDNNIIRNINNAGNINGTQKIAEIIISTAENY